MMMNAGYNLVRVVNSLRLRSPQVPANDPHHTRDNSRLIDFGVRFQGVWNTPCRVSNPRSALHSTMRNHSLRQPSHVPVTYECGQNGKLPFLDVTISKTSTHPCTVNQPTQDESPYFNPLDPYPIRAIWFSP